MKSVLFCRFASRHGSQCETIILVQGDNGFILAAHLYTSTGLGSPRPGPTFDFTTDVIFRLSLTLTSREQQS